MNEVLLLRCRSGVTQSRLAELAGTSQPTIAAYESGRKAPNLRTLQKLAEAVGLEARMLFVSPLTREDRRSLALHEAVAERLVKDPHAVISRARRTLALMAEKHPGAAALLAEWGVLLRLPVVDLVDVLRDPRPRARELRQVTPFAAVLSAADRTAVYRRFQASEEAAS